MKISDIVFRKAITLRESQCDDHLRKVLFTALYAPYKIRDTILRRPRSILTSNSAEMRFQTSPETHPLLPSGINVGTLFYHRHTNLILLLPVPRVHQSRLWKKTSHGGHSPHLQALLVHYCYWHYLDHSPRIRAFPSNDKALKVDFLH